MDVKPGMLPAPGIYFDLPESLYHSSPALGSGGILNLLISPLDFFINSRLNPDYVDTKTPAMVIGTAMHRRLLEPERFASLYATLPNVADYPGAIDGARDLQAKCKEMGLKGYSGKRVRELCDMLLDADPNLILWPLIEAEAIEANKGKEMLTSAVAADIERAHKFVTAHPHAAKAIRGGYSEVSIFWEDEVTGTPLKCRVDYLKTKAAISVKSFTNPLGKPIASAVAGKVAMDRYHVQEALYMMGVAAAKRMLRHDGSEVLHFMGESRVPDEWVLAFAGCKDHAHIFLFIEQGPVTNVVMREFQRWEFFRSDADIEGEGAGLMPMGMTENAYYSAGMLGVRHGIARYVDCINRFPPGQPWIVEEPLRPFVDIDFPLWMMDAPRESP